METKLKKKELAIGVDVGGGHLTIALVDIKVKKIVDGSRIHMSIDSQQDALSILTKIVDGIKTCFEKFGNPIIGIGISIPGPFDYKEGISKIFNCNKYDSLFGVNIKNYLFHNLKDLINHPSKIIFGNDAHSFLQGEAIKRSVNSKNVVGITLGTGIGSGFMSRGEIMEMADNVPQNGYIYNLPYRGKNAEDWFGESWFLNASKNKFSHKINNVEALAEKASKSSEAKIIFEEFGSNLGRFLSPILEDFDAHHLIIGGSIAKSFALFSDQFEAHLNGKIKNVITANDTEGSAIIGVVDRLLKKENDIDQKRNSKQPIMPMEENDPVNGYQIFPSFQLNDGFISEGFDSIAEKIISEKAITIDGYIGVLWSDFIVQLTEALDKKGIDVITYSVEAAYKNEALVNDMIEPYLGGDDPSFGKIYNGELKDFFEKDKLNSIQKNPKTLNILYGSGAALADWDCKIIYLDVPKNEIQYRSRSGSILNLGATKNLPPKPQYKRMFFIDWIVLNKHKASLLEKIDYFVDSQWLNEISWSTGDTLRKGLDEVSNNAFRVRPWFEPGVWGGHWMKNKIKGLTQDVVNYAWSFELIVPENGLIFTKNGLRLELSFDFLMYYNHEAVLGNAAETFGYNFPIRFDYLDTYDGANLSLQTHPTHEFIQENFGEKFTQDETYYILDAKPGAMVYLGFKEDVNKKEFHSALLESKAESKVIDVDKFVQKHPAKKHDLFLIPNGTIHCSGKDNLVLEISSTPYIYTLKMYDWMRLDLDGNPRPLNIERGMEVLNFDCKGEEVIEEYISKQKLIDSGEDWNIIHLSTHPKHFYEIFRHEFSRDLEIKTNDQCHILNLVEGDKLEVITNDRKMIVHFSETFVIPANVKTYKLVNLGTEEIKVVQSNVKPEFCSTRFD